MVKFDVRQLRYLSKEEFRCMTSLEVGMKNHEVVPSELVASIANLRHGGCYKILRELVRHKLIAYDHKNGIKGYHLTYSGYDYLALRSLTHQDAIHSIGNKIGVGKESDIYIAAGEDGTQYVLKLHRLGRVCFRKVKEKRDYLKKRKSAGWLYMSRLAAEREFSFLQALHTRGYPVPEPIACNRHAIVMKLVPGYPLSHVKEITNTAKVYTKIMRLIVRLAQMGLIHGDYNEFNLMINDDEQVTVIDLPQMISTSHENAEYYFNRDVECVRTWFRKRYNFDSDERPYLADIVCESKVDVEMKASGCSRETREDFERLTLQTGTGPSESEFSGDWSSESEDESDQSGGDGEDDVEEEEEEEEEVEEEVEEGSAPKLVEAKEKDEEENDSETSEEDSGSSEDEVPGNKEFLPYRDAGNEKKAAAHQFTVHQKSSLNKEEIKKKVRQSEAKKRLKASRVKKGEKYYINRQKRADAAEIKGAENWF